jgi:23S rRNA (guanosine2251-2'-O)-methyltransferase
MPRPDFSLDFTRPEKPERNDRPDRGARSDRGDRGDRGDRSPRGDRPAGANRGKFSGGDRKPGHKPFGAKPFGHKPSGTPAPFVMGWHPVSEALEAGKELQRVLIQRDEKGERTTALLGLLRTAGVPVSRVPREKLDRITRKAHQGIIAFLSPITYAPLEELVAAAFDAGTPPLFVAVDGVTDVRNLGAIARSAECFGATGLIVPALGSAPIQEDAIKASSGALLRLPVARVTSLDAALKDLQFRGIRVAGLTEKSELDISQALLERPLCIVLGDEETGLSPEVLARCDDRYRIPMTGTTASLNVSVSAGIALYAVAVAALSPGS